VITWSIAVLTREPSWGSPSKQLSVGLLLGGSGQEKAAGVGLVAGDGVGVAGVGLAGVALPPPQLESTAPTRTAPATAREEVWFMGPPDITLEVNVAIIAL